MATLFLSSAFASVMALQQRQLLCACLYETFRRIDGVRSASTYGTINTEPRLRLRPTEEADRSIYAKAGLRLWWSAKQKIIDFTMVLYAVACRTQH
eukprot:6185279-Pleurochrysis_carterae.AAC.2